ncbi:beta-ketoacyl synthase N-terminal-like domain-containing protein [Paenibacillus borealis]|uniref:beta-ketoacyl synthase N-terminal-like domain-containing protein n=1 Tax=Paenibacillus borealis TaxID=160799 RepID=UPI000693EF40|nr:beta-ketoacyl synthase N-terminal-like domain-containing protein [Paenibacillus borealis]
MSDANLEMGRILEQIKRGEMDPEQGYTLIRQLKSLPAAQADTKRAAGSNAVAQGGQGLHDYAVQYLKGLLSQVIGLEPERINAGQSLEDYGVDSVAIMEINSLLDKDFPNLPKTLMFEYGNLAELAGYFVQNQRELLEGQAGYRQTQQIHQIHQNHQNHQAAKPAVPAADPAPVQKKADEASKKYRSFVTPGKSRDQAEEQAHPAKDEGIAIIGISGAFPGARNLDEFWNNLKNGVDCISEIPPQRWDHSRYYDPEKGKRGKVYSKWGGFIDEYNCFDPLFFQLTPRDAEQLDPQERLFLESAHSAIEDGGYTRQSLWNTKTGVFVGVMYGHYQLYGAEETAKGNTMTLSSSYASIANRVSYFFNFNGPSIALDTMCSSSLTALHLACESIYRGDSEIAIAGGVNVTIHPDKYLFLCNQRFASSEGKCRAFGSGGDGYVPGEGVGALLLKPLAKAVEDGDNIYGVIRATSINHGGKTNGYTVPSPNAQSNIIAEALRKSGVHPRSISYMEAHGTGTALGDPIEISGLTKAFRTQTADNQYCAIGSVKSNVGHLESAAGVVSIIKVLLQMKHKQLVPSLHSEVLNPNINFEETPFYVQRRLEEWKPAVIEEGSMTREGPRYAAVSSFGAGGTNVHVILEEYKGQQESTLSAPHIDHRSGPHIFILSAKNKDRLNAYAKHVLDYIDLHTVQQGNAAEEISSAELRKYVIADITACFLQSALLPAHISAQEAIEEYGMSKEELMAAADALYEVYPVRLPMGLLTGSATIEGIAGHVLEQLGSATIAARHGLGAASEGEAEAATDANRPAAYDFRLEELIYTLQVGRETMEERLAIVVSGTQELREKLSQFLAGNRKVSDLYAGNISSGSEIRDVFTESEEGEAFLLSLVQSGKLGQLCRLWISGVNFNWQLLYTQSKPGRISLPTYPFDRTRYWYNSTEAAAVVYSSKPAALAAVIDTNESVFEEQCYKKSLSAADAYLHDHVVQGKMVLPGVVYLEMAWRAGLLSSREWRVQSVTDVTWRRTLELPADTDVQDVYIGLVAQEDGIGASIYSLNGNGQRVLHCTCTVNYTDGEAEAGEMEAVDIPHLLQTASRSINREDCYELFAAHGMNYGPNLRTIEAVYTGDYGTLSKLALPVHTQMPLQEYILHPGFADGAMQTALYSVLSGQRQNGTFVPFALQAVEVYRTLTPVSYCLVTPAASGKEQGMQFDLLLLDSSGLPAVRFSCLSGRDLISAEQNTKVADAETGASAGTALLDEMLNKLLAGEAGIDEVERMLGGI